MTGIGSFGCSGAMQWYVDSRTGDDANDGRGPKSAFKTVQHVVHAAKAGDTVLIAPGAYDQSLPKQISLLRAANVVVAVLGAH
ncbi:MAG: DUF1565 domain-containing protein [Methyloceanibacter sp.]